MIFTQTRLAIVSDRFEGFINNGRATLPNGDVVMPVDEGWTDGDYTAVLVQPADPVPSGKRAVSSTPQKVGDIWQFVHTLEDLPPLTREEMPVLSRRQFWLGAHSLGLTKAAVLSATTDDEIRIEIEESTEFHRTYESVVLLADLLGITPEQLDDVWMFFAAV